MTRETGARQVEPATLVEHLGTTWSAQAGITLRDRPMPLFQLLVLSVLSAAPISADVAATTARELWRAGWRTPQRMLGSTWQQRVDALGRGGYRRFDERTATVLADLATQLLDELDGDLRRLRDGDHDRLRTALERFPRVGGTGSGIFLREVQAVWPEVAPFLDDKALDGAGALGWPTTPDRLAGLVGPEGPRVAALASALVRVALGGVPAELTGTG